MAACEVSDLQKTADNLCDSLVFTNDNYFLTTFVFEQVSSLLVSSFSSVYIPDFLSYFRNCLKRDSAFLLKQSSVYN